MLPLYAPRSQRARMLYQTLGALLVFLTLFVGTTAVAHAATLCVQPGGGGGCYATIQAAVTAAQAGDTITIAAGTYAEHDIALAKNLTLRGASAATTIVNVNQLGRAFTVAAGIQASLRDLTIQNGKIQNDNGGAISNLGTVTLTNAIFKDNHVESESPLKKGGGAVYNKGTLNVVGSTFENNWHTGTMSGSPPYPPAPNGDGMFGGGAILNQGVFNVDTSTFRLNNAEPIGSVTGGGGALFVQGTWAVTNSTFDQNSAGCGGAMDNTSTGTVTRSTFSRNRGTY